MNNKIQENYQKTTITIVIIKPTAQIIRKLTYQITYRGPQIIGKTLPRAQKALKIKKNVFQITRKPPQKIKTYQITNKYKGLSLMVLRKENQTTLHYRTSEIQLYQKQKFHQSLKKMSPLVPQTIQKKTLRPKILKKEKNSNKFSLFHLKGSRLV